MVNSMMGYIPGTALHGIQLIGRYVTCVAFIQQFFHEDLVIVTRGGGGGGQKTPIRLALFLCQNHPTKSDVTSG